VAHFAAGLRAYGSRECAILRVLQELSPPGRLCRKPGGLRRLLRGRAARGLPGPGRCLHQGLRVSPCCGMRDRTRRPGTASDKSRRAHADVCGHEVRSEGQGQNSRPATSLRRLPESCPCARRCHGCDAEDQAGSLSELVHDCPPLRGGGRSRKPRQQDAANAELCRQVVELLAGNPKNVAQQLTSLLAAFARTRSIS